MPRPTVSLNDENSSASTERVSLDATIPSNINTGLDSPRAKVRGIPRINNAEDLGKGIVATNKNKTKEYTILLVGETGTGKTTLLSLFSNVLAGRSPNEFKLGHNQGNEADRRKNQSQTKHAKPYEFKSQNGIAVRILDTPGLADSRGIDHDERHKADIATVIQENIETINAVIILTNGTVQRLSVATDYALSTLSSMFPLSLANNIGIVFTCVTGHLGCNFVPHSLPEALRGIKGNQFPLDNSVARWQQLNIKRGEEWDIESEEGELEYEVEDCHKKALRVLARLFDWLDTLTPQQTKDILTVYERYREINSRVDNALARAEQSAERKAQLRNLLESTKSHKITMEQYRKVVTIPLWEQVQDKKRYHTICRHPGCYCNCHMRCTLPFSLNPEIMMTCWAMTLGPECRVCQHPATEHYHCRAFWKKRSIAREGIAEGLEQEYRDAKQKNDENEKEIVDLWEKIADLDRDMEEQLTTLGRLTATYASLCLNGRFIRQVKKSIALLERKLENIRRTGQVGPEPIRLVEKSLDDMNRRLGILQQVDGEDQENGRRADGGTSGGKRATFTSAVKSGIQAIFKAGSRRQSSVKHQGAPSSTT